MRREPQQTDTGLPAMVLPAEAPAEGSRLTAAICGLATLAVAAVLGISLACQAMNGSVGGDQPVTIVSRPPAADPTLIAEATPFDPPGCAVTAALR